MKRGKIRAAIETEKKSSDVVDEPIFKIVSSATTENQEEKINMAKRKSAEFRSSFSSELQMERIFLQLSIYLELKCCSSVFIHLVYFFVDIVEQST